MFCLPAGVLIVSVPGLLFTEPIIASFSVGSFCNLNLQAGADNLDRQL